MFIPFFIAILLGLATPSTTNNSSTDNNSTMVTTDAGADEDTGGEIGNNPPR